MGTARYDATPSMSNIRGPARQSHPDRHTHRRPPRHLEGTNHRCQQPASAQVMLTIDRCPCGARPARAGRVEACSSDSQSREPAPVYPRSRLQPVSFRGTVPILPFHRAETWSGRHGIRRTPRPKEGIFKTKGRVYRGPPTPCDQASLPRHGQQEPVWLTCCSSRLWAERRRRGEAGRRHS